MASQLSFLRKSAMKAAFVILVACVLTPTECFGQDRRDAAKYGSAEAATRLEEQRQRLSEAARAKAARANAGQERSSANTPKELQDLRDEVIATRAVVKYMMNKERVSNSDQDAVVEYVNNGKLKLPTDAGDRKRVVVLLERDEVRAWLKAELEYLVARDNPSGR
jgi:hypothetical protein